MKCGFAAKSSIATCNEDVLLCKGIWGRKGNGTEAVAVEGHHFGG